MHKKLHPISRFKVGGNGRRAKKLKLLSRHPFAVPIVTFLVLTILAVGGVLLFGGKDKVEASGALIVIISHDNVQQTVPVHESTTVSALLAKLKIPVNRGDVVEPSLKSQINQDGFRINIYRAVPVEIVDGQHKTFTFSAATTPRSIVAQAGGKPVYPEDNLSLVPTTNFIRDDAIGQRIVIDRATPVHVNLYGAQVDLRTHAKTVGELIKSKGIKLHKGDQLKPAVNTPITKDQQIFVLRKGEKIVSSTETIPAPVQYIKDPSLSLGTSAVRQQGSPGKRIITYWIKKSKSGKVSRKKIQSVLVAPPVKEIVVRGTAVVGPGEVTSKITYWANKYGVSSSWMLQIAKCESNFNPGSVNPYGYKGLYQYGASQWSTDTSGAGISGASIWDPNAQAHAAAWHISHYGAGAWSCA